MYLLKHLLKSCPEQSSFILANTQYLEVCTHWNSSAQHKILQHCGNQHDRYVRDLSKDCRVKCMVCYHKLKDENSLTATSVASLQPKSLQMRQTLRKSYTSNLQPELYISHAFNSLASSNERWYWFTVQKNWWYRREQWYHTWHKRCGARSLIMQRARSCI